MGNTQETSAPATTGNDVSVTVRDSREYFNEFLPRLAQEQPGMKIGNLNFCCVFRIRGEKGGTWLSTIEGGKPIPIRPCDDTQQAPCIVETDNETLMQVVTGKMKPTQAFFKGRIKIEGDLKMILKLVPLLPIFFPKTR